MAGNVRVFELAKRLGIASQDLMALLQEMDIVVTSPIAELEPGVDKMIQKKLGGQRATAQRLKSSATVKKVVAGDGTTRGKIKRKARKVLPDASPAVVADASATGGLSTLAPGRAIMRTVPAAERPAASAAPAAPPVEPLEEVPLGPQPMVGPPTPEQAAAAAVAPAPTIRTVQQGAAPAAPAPPAAPPAAPGEPEPVAPKEFVPTATYPTLPETGEGVAPQPTREQPSMPDPAILARVQTTQRSKQQKKTNLREKVKQRLKETKDRPVTDPILPALSEDVSERQQRRRDRPKENVIEVPEVVTVDELSGLLGVKANQLIMTLMQNGVMATKNQQLDMDIVELLADHFDYAIRISTGETDVAEEVVEDNAEDLESRAAVVTVMGHVDHGKTSLLDYIRTSRVAEGEAGGITQHIGAYNVDTERGRVVFLDTPGHEAFTAMRAHGAKVTDVVCLVVAADDGVKPQTVEAINHAQAANVPLVVAINKTDKPEADAERVKRELSENNVFVEGYGGEVQAIPVSALTGAGLPDLLERLALESDLLELKANPHREARGVVIEARLDRGRGAVATILVQSGTLSTGDCFVAGMQYGKVRNMHDDLGHSVNAVPPSTPVEILGFNGVPMAGDQFVCVPDERKARQIAENRQRKVRMRAATPAPQRVTLEDLHDYLSQGAIEKLKVIIKSDVQGSAQALQDSLAKLSTDEVTLECIHSGVGGITESDVMLASASNALIIGFNVRPEPNARRLSQSERVDIRLYRVIYNVIDDVKAAMGGLLKPEMRETVTGRAEVRDTFRISGLGTIAGCMVLSGEINRNNQVRVLRDNVVVNEGAIGSLRRFKDDVKSVQAGLECGLGVEKFNDVKVGDILETFAVEHIERTL